MAKKNFGEIANPALQFMTQPEETKSKRVNLLMLPSIYADITKIAAMKRTSVNDLVNTLLQEHIEANKELLEKYDQVFGE